jgi:hypothetical protein
MFLALCSVGFANGLALMLELEGTSDTKIIPVMDGTDTLSKAKRTYHL